MAQYDTFDDRDLRLALAIRLFSIVKHFSSFLTINFNGLEICMQACMWKLTSLLYFPVHCPWFSLLFFDAGIFPQIFS